MPDFSIDGYQDVTVPKPETALTDAEFDAELSRVLDSRSTMEPVLEDRAIADGDFAEIDFHGEAAQADAEASETPRRNARRRTNSRATECSSKLAARIRCPPSTKRLRGSKPGQELKFEVSYPAGLQRKAARR